MKPDSNFPLSCALILGIVSMGAAALPACSAEDPAPAPGTEPAQVEQAQDPEIGAMHVAGGGRIVDPQNGVSLDVPEGWHAIVPTLGEGSITIANYDLRVPETVLPERSTHDLSPDMAKIDITTFDLDEGEDVAGWVEKRRDEMMVQSADLHGDFGTLQAPIPVGDTLVQRLADRDGAAFVARQGGVDSALEIALSWDGRRVLHAVVLPADSRHLDEALALLDRVRPAGAEPAELGASTQNDRAALARPFQSLIRQSYVTAPPKSATTCSGWTGSDTGSYAPNTPITLNLPFYYGTWWQAGGYGSFWGNGAHGNCFDDYFAIDFNLATTSSCTTYADDAGQKVYAAANGTAYKYTGSTGYGNYVDVVHSNGRKTRYAHLQSIAISTGQAVTTQTILGYVGSTGNSSAPHLHFGFYTNNVSRCNKSGGCPNGEAAESPQTPKPSPMYTALGSKTVADYGCYQAPP